MLYSGENFINNQVFSAEILDVAVGDADQMGAICVSDQASTDEADDAASIALANGLTGGNHCHPATTLINTDGTVVLGPEVFTGGIDINATQIINSIAICGDNNNIDYAECNLSTNPIAFAEIVTSAVQLGDTETVDITYTFDLSSPNT